MKFWAGLNQENKGVIITLVLGAIISSVAFIAKESGFFSSSAIADTSMAGNSENSRGNTTTISGAGVSGVTMGDGSKIEISTGDKIDNSHHSVTNDNSVDNSNHSVNNGVIDNSVDNRVINDNSTDITYINQGPSEADKAAEAKRKESAALLMRKRDLYKKVSDSFHNSSVFTLDPDSLVDALDNFSKSKQVLSDIELTFSPETQEKARAFFENARQTIACSWGEHNQPNTCHQDNADHPERKYKILFAALKSNMARDIGSSP